MKYALVTGAFGGMGKSAVKRLSEENYTVFALDIACGESYENVIGIETDITDQKSVENALAIVSSYTDRLDACLHFAGVYMLNSLLEMPQADFLRIMNVNVTGAFSVNRVFAPLFKTGTRIVILTSELAPLKPLPFTGIYAVTKGALDKYAYSLRMEAQLSGIHVSVLRAGAVDTGMLDVSTRALDAFTSNTKAYAFSAKRFRDIVNRVESRKITPDRIAEKICAILSKRNPRFSYSVNRNPLLLLLNALPERMQFWIIRRILLSK
ncbi:MAG: SDR family NAD(P)-dependent oxidoreductase [Clostridia bacterium]|nr:SDR family NAD(P)-dependent oxidoreductase [Clostridia bacterium]MBQ4619164.1 SDR family NAD(P)-dependent oxidoreductase [Clostridia bacterium]